jgi:hypothetical protein
LQRRRSGVIGVSASPGDLGVAREFFELFKTPWEPARPGRFYDVHICTTDSAPPEQATLTLVYGATERPLDREAGIRVTRATGLTDLVWGDARFPTYLAVATFECAEAGRLRTSNGAAEYCLGHGDRRVCRIGYDLFGEVAHLLTTGQPASQAMRPTLEVHIALIRDCLERSCLPYVEIPPRPFGADFVCCLTHDVDFFGLRRHFVDRTLGGVVARGTAGTIVDVVRGRRSLNEAARNVAAVMSLPFVAAGVSRDPWHPFRDYAVADRGLPSTFFVIPYKNRAGVGPDGQVRPDRAVKYGVADIASELGSVRSGSELALHGIDAWQDDSAGRAEAGALEAVGHRPNGVRMHWLYCSETTPRHAENVGLQRRSRVPRGHDAGVSTARMRKAPGATADHHGYRDVVP